MTNDKNPELYKEIFRIKQRQFEEKGGYAMYSSMFDDAFCDALNLVKSDQLNAKIDTLDEKISNMTNSIEGQQSTSETEVVPAWMDSVLDLSFLTPENKKEYEEFCVQNNDLTGQLNDLYLRIQKLHSDRTKAIAEFDISKVVDIDTNLEKLNADYKSKFGEASKLKAKLDGKNAEWEVGLNDLREVLKDEKWDKVKDFDRTKYTPQMLKEYRSTKAVEMVKNFIDDFPKDQAKKILNNQRIKDLLKDDYNKLVEQYL